MDQNEATVARKRLERWPERDREWAKGLTPSEKDVLVILLAYLDAHPAENE